MPCSTISVGSGFDGATMSHRGQCLSGVRSLRLRGEGPARRRPLVVRFHLYLLTSNSRWSHRVAVNSYL